MNHEEFIEKSIECVRMIGKMEGGATNDRIRRIEAILDENCIVIGNGMGECFDTKEIFLENLRKQIKTPKTTAFEVVNREYKGQIVSEDVCVVYGMVHVHSKERRQGQHAEMTTRFSATCKKSGEEVKVTHIHNSVPFQVGGNDQYQPQELIKKANEAVEYSQKLEEEQKRTRSILENTGILIWIYEKKTSKRLYSLSEIKGFPKLENVTMDELIQTGRIAKESIGDFLHLYELMDQGEESVTDEIQMIDIYGNFHWLRVNLIYVEGRVDEIIASAIDVTQSVEAQKRLENEIKVQEEIDARNLFAKARFNVTDNCVESYTIEDDFDAGYHGDNYDELTSVISHTAFMVEERKQLLEMLQRENVLERFERGITDMSVEYQRVVANGRKRWVRTTIKVVSNPDTNSVMSFLYSYDIDEEKRKDIIYHSLTESVYEYITCVDLVENTYRTYSQVEGLIGILKGNDTSDYSKVVSKTEVRQINKEDCEKARYNLSIEGIRHNLKEKDKYQFTLRIDEADGKVHTKRITIYYMDKTEETVVITREDITEQVLEEQKRSQALSLALDAAKQASKAKSEFLSRMSHELRTPMNAIIGLSALAAGDIQNPAAIEDAIGKIGMSARYLLSLINDILEMSRIESGRMSLNLGTFDFEKLISNVNTIIYGQCRDKGIDYDAIVNGYTENTYVGDATKLQQILVNVLGNAVKFTPAGGKITLSIEQVMRNNEKTVLRFVCSDTGVGIEETYIPHLFEAFSQEKASFTSTTTGTGLGLAITKSMVEMMNGSIQVRSIKDIGSVFTIEVELGISEDSKQKWELLSYMNLSKLSALVVDDDVVVCQSTQKILSSMGMEAEWVESGAKAIAYVRDRHLKKRDYDTIFIDWKMPDMDGIETTRQIRKIVGDDITIIIITAYDWTNIEAQAREAGADLFMEKPLFQSSIMSAFEKIFSKNKDRIIEKSEKVYDFSGRHILLAEDHPLNAEIAKRLLESKGADVTVVSNGLEALETYTTKDDYYYDVILMDIRMPVMDGLAATTNIRNLKKEGSKEIPIIAMTANAFDEDVEQSIAHGMNAHLTKPIEPDVLYETLSKMMSLGI